MNQLKYVFYVILFALSACVSVPEGPTKNEKASDINVQLGIGYLQQNNLEIAKQKLTRALVQNPESAVAHNAYGILQERFKHYDLAEKHYKRATELEPENSQANNNYGAFLCRQKRQAESEAYFIKAVQQPLYKTPEYAYTNAAVCLMQINQNEKAKVYLEKALSTRSNFSTALINLADIDFQKKDYENSLLYLKRYNLVANPTARSLWLEAQNYLETNNTERAQQKIEILKQKFPKSKEYLAWKTISNE